MLMTFLYIVKVGKEMKSAAAFQKKKKKNLVTSHPGADCNTTVKIIL